MSFINPPNFKSAMATLASTIDDTFGEQLKIIPCVSRPNYPAQAREDQAIFVHGVFTAKPTLALESDSLVNRGKGNGLVEARVPIFSFARAQLPWGLHRQDRIVRLCDGSQYEVTRVESDPTSQRITCHVVELGVMSQ